MGQKKVKQLAKTANWDFKYGPGENWAYYSAKKFLEVCAKKNLSIEFFW